MSSPLVSVVIPVYNAEQYIQSTLDSVFSQTYTELEVITVDDDSPDGSAEILKHYGKELRYIHQNNGGPAAARNTGIQAACGEYIAFIDADDQWLPEKIAQQVKLMTSSVGNVALVHTDVTNLYAHGTENAGSKDLPALMTKESAFNELFTSNFIATSSVLCKRELFDELGGFDESRRLFAVEDYDMWLRVACHYDLAFIPERLLRYRMHDEGISKNIDRSYQNERNVLDKWYAGNSNCLNRLNFSKNDRYTALMRDWGDDLAWSGRRKDAYSVYRESLQRFGVSRSIVYRLIKLMMPRHRSRYASVSK